MAFDGVPYRIAKDIRDQLLICPICNLEVDTATLTFKCHLSDVHRMNDDDSVSAVPVFKDVLLVPDAGHMEKNLLLAIFSLCRHEFLERLADMFGFQSKNAKEFILNCGNHHISWQILYISYEAFVRELTRIYVIECLKENNVATSTGFVQWKNERVINPNYNFYYDLVFNIFLGLKCFISGIRRNNSLYALAGRQKIAPLMFVGRHHIYKQLIVNDMKIRVEAPPKVATYITLNESFSRSGNEGKEVIILLKMKTDTSRAI